MPSSSGGACTAVARSPPWRVRTARAVATGLPSGVLRLRRRVGMLGGGGRSVEGGGLTARSGVCCSALLHWSVHHAAARTVWARGSAEPSCALAPRPLLPHFTAPLPPFLPRPRLGHGRGGRARQQRTYPACVGLRPGRLSTWTPPAAAHAAAHACIGIPLHPQRRPRLPPLRLPAAAAALRWPSPRWALWRGRRASRAPARTMTTTKLRERCGGWESECAHVYPRLPPSAPPGGCGAAGRGAGALALAPALTRGARIWKEKEGICVPLEDGKQRECERA